MSWHDPVSFAEAPFEIIDGDRGKNYPKQSEFSDAGHCLFLSATNVTKTGFDFSACQFVDEKRDAALNKGKLLREDIVLTTRGTIGNTAYFNNSVPFNHLRINSGMVILRCDKTKLLPAFLYHFVRSPSFHSQVNGLRSGVAQPQLPIRDMRQIRLPLPPLPVQQLIAGILSTYDELIENSQQRIKILEAMARALYREWFVHFRFPDNENLPRVASTLGEIPQGWEVKKLGEIISAHIGGGWGKETPDQEHTEPAWVIRGTDIPEARYSQIAGVPHRVHTASNLRSRRLTAGDIVFEVSGGSKGQPVGRTLLITSELLTSLGGDVICASFCKRIQPDLDGYGSELLYLSFLEGYESGEIEQYQVQSTGISNFKWTEYIANTDRVVPPAALRKQFREHVAPLFTQVAMLGRKIQNLRRTRDLLLPRLLSGQALPLDQIEPAT
jgi:type I restriction enzyme S subunit